MNLPADTCLIPVGVVEGVLPHVVVLFDVNRFHALIGDSGDF